MSITQNKAEKLGWIFLPGENLQSAEKVLDSGAVVRQQALTLDGLLAAVEWYEDLQARTDTSEPVTHDSPTPDPSNLPVNTPDEDRS